MNEEFMAQAREREQRVERLILLLNGSADALATLVTSEEQLFGKLLIACRAQQIMIELILRTLATQRIAGDIGPEILPGLQAYFESEDALNKAPTTTG